MIQLLDNALDKWLQSYCRLFVPLPSQSKLPQVMYSAELFEQVLSQCGNTDQQAQVAALNQLRTKEQLADLNRSCTMMLQKLDPKWVSKSNPSRQNSSFLSAMSHTLKKIVTSSSSQKSLTAFEKLPSDQVTISSNENPSISHMSS
jgi:glutamine synthetase adenylyltransferase